MNKLKHGILPMLADVLKKFEDPKFQSCLFTPALEGEAALKFFFSLQGMGQKERFQSTFIQMHLPVSSFPLIDLPLK